MESEKYIHKVQKRPDGFYAVVFLGKEKVFDQKCSNVEGALDIALREVRRLSDK